MQAVESNVSRRRALGAALALGAGAAIGSTTSFPSLGVPLAAAGGDDLVHGELIRQLKEGVRAMRGERPGEAARSVAGTLRVIAAHYQSSGVDDQVKAALRKAIARDGRDTVLRWEADASMREAEERDFGMADLHLPREPFNLRERERALDAMLAVGATPVLLNVASELSRRAPQLERAALTPVALRQCSTAQSWAYAVEYVALASCLLNPILCAGFGGAYFGLKFSLYMSGC